MPLAFRAASSVTTFSSATSVAVSVPAGIQDNDILLVEINAGVASIPTPAGWTLLTAPVKPSSFGTYLHVFWRVAQSEPASHTFSWTGSNGGDAAMIAYSGGDTSTPIDTYATATDASSGTSHVAPAVTTTRDTNIVIVFWGGGFQSTNVWTAPAGMTQRYAGGGWQSISASDKVQATAGNSGTFTGTTTKSSQAAMVTVALNVSQNLPVDTSGDGHLHATGTISVLEPFTDSGDGHLSATATASYVDYEGFSGSGDGHLSATGGGDYSELADLSGDGHLHATGSMSGSDTLAPSGSGHLRADGQATVIEGWKTPADLAHHGTPRSKPRVHVYDAPNGRQISDDLGLVAEGLQHSTKALGGFGTATFSLRRDGLTAWPDLKAGAHIEIRDQGGLLFAGMLDEPEGGNQFELHCRADGYWDTHLLDGEFDTSSSSNRTPKAAIEEVVAQKCPLITVMPGLVGDHDGWTIDLSTQSYRRIAPRDLFTTLAKYGDSAGNIWDIAIWDRQTIWYQTRDYETADYQVDLHEGVITRAGSRNDVRNIIRVEYRTAAGSTAVTSDERDQESIDRHGPRELTLHENEITASMARSLAKSTLAYMKDLHPQVSIRTTKIYNRAGGPVPCGQVRAGSVVYVPTIGNLFIVETDYNAESGELTLTPEHDWHDPDLNKRFMLTEQRARQQSLNQSSGVTGTRIDPNVARPGQSYLKADTYDKAGVDGAINTKTANYYTKAEANNQFVDAAGDTMSGKLTLNGGLDAGGSPLQFRAYTTFLGQLQAAGIGIGGPASAQTGSLNMTGPLNITNNGGCLIQGNSHLGSLGVGANAPGGSGTGLFASTVNVNGTLFANGGLQTSGNKQAIIIEPDGSITGFAAQEGEIARFVVAVDLTVEEASLPAEQFGPLMVSRLPDAFVRNVEPEYQPLTTPVYGVDGLVTGYRCLVHAPVRYDLPVQMSPFGVGIDYSGRIAEPAPAAPTPDEPEPA